MSVALDAGVAALLAQTRVRVDPRTFIIAGLPPSQEGALRRALSDIHAPFFVQMFPHERTIVLPEDEWVRLRAKFPGAREEPGYRLVTLEVALDWQVTGYLAAVTSALARAETPVGVFSSFHHDHLIVRDAHLANAVAGLERLIDAAHAAAEHVGGEPRGSPTFGT